MEYLRKCLIVILTVFTVAFVACEKDGATPEDEFTETTTTCRIDKIIRVEKGNTDILSFGYTETNDTLRRVGEKHDGETNDYEVTEVEFNDDGSIKRIEEYDVASNPDFLLRSYTYTWSGNKIVTIVEQRNDVTTPYSKTHTYTYNGDKLASVTESGNPDGENMKMLNIVYENGNVKTMDIDFKGDGITVAKVAGTFDDKYNHVKHLLPLPEVMLELFNNNNIISIELTEELSMGLETAPVGSKIIDRTYTYNDQNEVASKTDKPTFVEESGGNRVWTITYLCD